MRRELAVVPQVGATTTDTVEEAWNRFRRVAELRLRPGTIETYTGSMTKHVLPAIGEIPVSNLDPLRVRKLLNDFLAAGMNPGTALNAIAALRSTLALLVEEGVLAVNPASVKKGWAPKLHAEPKSLTNAQLAEFLIAAKMDPLYSLIVFLTDTGVRLGEALALRWEDVDLDGRVAAIKRSVRLAHEAQTKTRFGMRSVDLSKRVVELLKFVPKADSAALVFHTHDTFIRARYVHSTFHRVSKHAGLPPVHPHMLRHSWATRMLKMGSPLNYVSRSLGHHSVAFTAQIYASAHPDSRHADVDRLANLTLLTEPVGDR
jgi:integrase